jgi:hypothetical protein
MRFGILVSLLLVATLAGGATVFSAAAYRAGLAQTTDPISGEWDVSFSVQGTTTPASFNLKLEGDKVTGTAASAHTGPGTLRDGKWANNMLSFTVDFKSHESIAITGSLQNEKLAGEFRTEGFVSKWEAKRKSAAAANSASATAQPAPAGTDSISGEWDTTFVAQGTSAPATLKLKLDGEKVSGTFASPHLGEGTIIGSWKADALSCTMDSSHMTAAITGKLKDGKLIGAFESGAMKGTWEAKKK